ncbi:MAG: SRPBCC family protein [Bacteroidia bacterium]|nr:SRPBCC family protein [Bacteroidia bacterium]
MRIVILPIISFIVLFFVITGISLFIPSHIRISKAININADRKTVMKQIRDVTKWKNWYPGADSLQVFFSGGKAKGLMRDSLYVFAKLTDANDSSVIATTTGRSLKGIVIGWHCIPGRSVYDVTIQWYMDFHLRWYPWEKFRSLTFEKTYGLQMEKGLTNLKALVEK